MLSVATIPEIRAGGLLNHVVHCLPIIACCFTTKALISRAIFVPCALMVSTGLIEDLTSQIETRKTNIM